MNLTLMVCYRFANQIENPIRSIPRVSILRSHSNHSCSQFRWNHWILTSRSIQMIQRCPTIHSN